jgi:hypothetical protein
VSYIVRGLLLFVAACSLVLLLLLDVRACEGISCAVSLKRLPLKIRIRCARNSILISISLG